MDEPQVWGLPQMLGPDTGVGLLEVREEYPELVALGGFYAVHFPHQAQSAMLDIGARAKGDPRTFIQWHVSYVRDLKHKIHAWLAIPDDRRIKSLAKHFGRSQVGLSPVQVAQELDHRVWMLSKKWS
jgi:hypothetical protein